jgi:phosphate:Na+ symporter
MNTTFFLPFVKPYVKLLGLLIPEKKAGEKDGHYKFVHLSSALAGTPELNIIRVEKEIRDMAGIVSGMYNRFNTLLQDLPNIEDRENATAKLHEELKQKEDYADEMREILTSFLMECTREKLSSRSEQRVTQLVRVISILEEMSDECCAISFLLDKSVRKDHVIKEKEMNDLVPYLNLVGEFFRLLQEQMGQKTTILSFIQNKKLEVEINISRKQLQKLGRKRIEAGKDVKTELFFIDLVRRIEKLGDYCFDISGILGKIL